MTRRIVRSLPGVLATDADDIWNTAGASSPGQRALVDAQFYAHVTDNFYCTNKRFDWQYHYPQGMVSSAHLGRKYNNAYWNGTQMAYGDGDGRPSSSSRVISMLSGTS